MENPLPEFAAYRARHSLGDYYEFEESNHIAEEWLRERDRTGRKLPPPGFTNSYDAFLLKEGRRSRRLIDVPDPGYRAGHTELNELIDRVISSGHEPSMKALIASIQVDLDWMANYSPRGGYPGVAH